MKTKFAARRFWRVFSRDEVSRLKLPDGNAGWRLGDYRAYLVEEIELEPELPGALLHDYHQHHRNPYRAVSAIGPWRGSIAKAKQDGQASGKPALPQGPDGYYVPPRRKPRLQKRSREHPAAY